MQKDSAATGLSYFYGRFGQDFPVYTANISAAHGVNDTSGEFYLNLRRKLLYLNVNLTEGKNSFKRCFKFLITNNGTFQMEAKVFTCMDSYQMLEALFSTYIVITRTKKFRMCLIICE